MEKKCRQDGKSNRITHFHNKCNVKYIISGTQRYAVIVTTGGAWKAIRFIFHLRAKAIENIDRRIIAIM